MTSPTARSYRIAEVADLTGFTPPTLRYYEEIGLMPPPERTAAGYRAYDDRAVQRLAFIARAKRLGCSLEEIADLAAAWDGDDCGPVQHRLRSLVGSKLDQAQTQIADLIALTAELQATAAHLASQPVDGPCDDTCACSTSAPTDDLHGQRTPVTLGTRSADPDGPPIACSLRGEDIPTRLADWQAALQGAEDRSAIPNGVRVRLDPQADLAEVSRLMAAEYECCPFFEFALTVDARGPALEVTAPPEAAAIVTAGFGAPS